MGPYLLLIALIALILICERIAPERVNRIEENILIFLMFLITAVSFSQVVARYMFNTGWSAALEFTTIGFSWMILLGMSYGIKHSSHIGVDAILTMVPPKASRAIAVFGAVSCGLYGAILLESAWLGLLGIEQSGGGAMHYWSKLYQIKIGAEELRWPEWVQSTFGVKDRVQRWIILTMLPVSLALIILRSGQAVYDILRGERKMVIANHELEDLLKQRKTSADTASDEQNTIKVSTSTKKPVSKTSKAKPASTTKSSAKKTSTGASKTSKAKSVSKAKPASTKKTSTGAKKTNLSKET